MTNWTRHDTRALIEAAADAPCDLRGAVRIIRRHYAEDGLVERMARFEAFVEHTNRVPLVWGVSDCSLQIADWALANWYADAAAHLRGAYDDEAGCRALLASAGGLAQVVDDCARSIGLVSIQEPEFGAIGVVGSATRPDRQWAAIWSGARWMVKWGDGSAARWTPFVAPCLTMWRV